MGFAWPEEAAQFMAQDIFSGEFGKIGLESDKATSPDTKAPEELT